jgi:aspartyl-tRNA(Asn)/glutamyl-tRNA(Gln) amidotransferase subunit A
MADDALCWMSATDLAAAVRRRKVSPVEVVDAVLDRADRLRDLNAYCLVDADGARRVARAAERAAMRRDARLGPLHGVPFSVKDLVVTKGMRTTFGTPLYRDHVPGEDAPSVARLKAAGAILLGKTNTPTFGWVGVTDNLLFGPTRNPWSRGHTPGGSSGGAGAAAAAGLGPLHLGTDGGGSIRKPAAWCGVFGLKASYGRVPVHPHGAAWSLSHAGPMTRTVKDAALMLSVMAGPDERDQFSLPGDRVDYVKGLGSTLSGLRVAYTPTLGGIAPAVDPEIAAAAARAARALRGFGARVESVEPRWPSPYECWRATFYGGIATRLVPYLDRKAEIDPGLLAIVEEVRGWEPTRYVQAWFDRLAWWQHARAFFEKYDLLLSPVVACPPLPIGEWFATEIAGVKVGREAGSAFTFPFNLTGQPAASVPCGFTTAGLPIGLQVVGRRFADATVLRASACLERALPWAARRPPD